MKTEIEEAVKILIKYATADDVDSHEALQLTQAALNLAHTAAVLNSVK